MALQPSRESYTGLPSATTIFSTDLQPEKACIKTGQADLTISVTDLGMVTLASEVQSLKAVSPIEVTPSGITTSCKPVQPSKA